MLSAEEVAKHIIAYSGVYIVLEAILSIKYHCNMQSRIAHLGRVSRIVAGIVIIVMVVIL